MTKTPIAEIKLAPGEVGYYDEYSRIYLSSVNPSTIIYSGTNCTQIKRSIKSGRLRLIRGGFDIEQKIDNNIEKQIEPKKNYIIKVKEDKKTEEVKIETEKINSETKNNEEVQVEHKETKTKIEEKKDTTQETKTINKRRSSKKQEK